MTTKTHWRTAGAAAAAVVHAVELAVDLIDAVEVPEEGAFDAVTAAFEAGDRVGLVERDLDLLAIRGDNLRLHHERAYDEQKCDHGPPHDRT